MQFQVTVGNYIILTKTIRLNSFPSGFLGIVLFWSLFRCCEVMFLHVQIAQDVVISIGVFSWAEIPSLFLRIIRSLFQAFHLALKVQDIVSLFVPQSTILVLGQHIDEVLLFKVGYFALVVIVRILLSDWIVNCILLFDKLVCDLFVGYRIELNVLLLVSIFADFILPHLVSVFETQLLLHLANVSCHYLN